MGTFRRKDKDCYCNGLKNLVLDGQVERGSLPRKPANSSLAIFLTLLGWNRGTFEKSKLAVPRQGGLGNCGMVTGVACLADFPGYLSSLFLTKVQLAFSVWLCRLGTCSRHTHTHTYIRTTYVSIRTYLTHMCRVWPLVLWSQRPIRCACRVHLVEILASSKNDLALCKSAASAATEHSLLGKAFVLSTTDAPWGTFVLRMVTKFVSLRALP